MECLRTRVQLPPPPPLQDQERPRKRPALRPPAGHQGVPRRDRPACTRQLRHPMHMSHAHPASNGSPAGTGSVVRTVERWRNGTHRLLDDHVVEEVPVAFVYNDEPFAVMMATPGDLADFATGFALSEGIVERPGDLVIEGVEAFIEGIEIRLRIPAGRAEALALRRRSMSGRSGCGVCE